MCYMGQINPERWDEAASETIRAERAAARLSQAEVAKRAGIPRVSYIRYETGERKPNVVHIAAIAQALNLSFSAFARQIEERARNR